MPGEWKDKRVLITGADGFIGSHLTEKMLELGGNVSVIVNGPSDPTKFRLKNISHIADKIDVHKVDIGKPDSIPIIKKAEPDVIFHLAANAYVPNSFEHPIEVMETNLIGTLNVLHASMDMDVDQIVCTSSSEIYGTPEYVPIDEKHPLNPAHPYGASKVAADRFAFSYYNTYHLPIAIVRPFNTYGPRHTYDVIPKFIDLALSGKDLTVEGDGNQTRDFTYVSDTVNAFLVMGSDKKAIGEAVNFGTGKETSINELAEKIIELCKSNSKIVYTKERVAQVKRLCCDYSKAKRLFSWEPKVSIADGLKLNIDYVGEKR